MDEPLVREWTFLPPLLYAMPLTVQVFGTHHDLFLRSATSGGSVFCAFVFIRPGSLAPAQTRNQNESPSGCMGVKGKATWHHLHMCELLPLWLSDPLEEAEGAPSRYAHRANATMTARSESVSSITHAQA